MSDPTDQDSHMTSSPPTALLSPAESQTPNMPTASSGARIANSNGKRPHGALLNGGEEDDVDTMPNAGRQNQPVQTHAASGYRWSRPEDEPGFSWCNKKAYDEMSRAWETLVHKDSMVKGRYGDPLEMAENEAATLASMKS